MYITAEEADKIKMIITGTKNPWFGQIYDYIDIHYKNKTTKRLKFEQYYQSTDGYKQWFSSSGYISALKTFEQALEK